jgi:hypothetical protein
VSTPEPRPNSLAFAMAIASLLVGGLDDRGDRPEDLVVVRRLAGLHAAEDGGRYQAPG